MEVRSVYGHRHRASNVAEGRHNALQWKLGQRRAGPYTLLGVLRAMCDGAGDAATRILRGEVVGSSQVWKVTNVEKRAQEEWEKYRAGEKTAWELLRACAYLAHQPFVSARARDDVAPDEPPL